MFDFFNNLFLQVKELRKLVFLAFEESIKDRTWILASAVAYNVLFTLAPLLLIILTLISQVYKSQQVRIQLEFILEANFGQITKDFLIQLLNNLEQFQGEGLVGVLGFLILLITSTGLLDLVHTVLEQIWSIPHYNESIFEIIITRLKYFGLILLFGTSWLGYFLISNFLTYSTTGLSVQFLQNFIQFLNTLLIFFFGVVLLGLSIQVLLPVNISWKSIFIGSTTTLFLVFSGNYLVSVFISLSNPQNPFGAAGSVIIFLVWVYYLAQIFLYGMEFTKVLENKFK